MKCEIGTLADNDINCKRNARISNMILHMNGHDAKGLVPLCSLSSGCRLDHWEGRRKHFQAKEPGQY